MFLRLFSLLTCVCLIAGLPAAAAIDYVALINTVRLEGCGSSKSADERLVSIRHLDAAARRVANGEGLIDAAKSSGYLARNIASIHMRNVDSDAEAAAILANRFCEIVTDAGLEEIGVYTRGDDVWTLLAKPLGAPTPQDSPATVDLVLQLINEARATERPCGSKTLPSANPLQRSAILELAAQHHAEDMAEHSFLSHEGSDGSMPQDRVTRAGYNWRTVAENVAAGQPSANEVVATWLASPGHCSGLMSQKYSETGVAFVVDESSKDGIYWVQVFGSRK